MIDEAERLDVGMICTCGEKVAVGDEVRARHPTWTIETALFALNDIGGPVSVGVDMWFLIWCAPRWRDNATGRVTTFVARVQCDEVLVGIIVLYEELLKRFKQMTGDDWDPAVSG